MNLTSASDGGVNADLVPGEGLPKAETLSSAGVPASPSAPLVVGLDLSLAATGVCHMHGDRIVTDTIQPPPNRRHGLLRLRWLRTHLVDLIGLPTLVVVEGPSYGSTGAGQHDRAGLYWLVLDKLWARGVPVAICPPANLKQYATGKGGGKNASKDQVVLAAERRFPNVISSNDEADALWLAAMGVDYLTGSSRVPEAHRAGLLKVTWPTIARAS